MALLIEVAQRLAVLRSVLQPSLQPGRIVKLDEVPEGVDQEKLRGLPATFQKLDSPEVAKASKKIATHAKDVCKLSFVS